ncbi:MAG: hypothetical protein EP297_11205 [Gammaproteobacteria bacterium]|nr:MAG: hypothetical protein EP297_11205 [Gammaproteobacteria bacterium]
MKIQILSDLHNEFLRHSRQNPKHKWDGSIPETDADIIVLAGDIDTGTQGVEWAIGESGRLEKPIVYVMGNHEFYTNEYFSLKKKIAQRCHDTDVHCLDCSLFFMGDVRFIGATLWTDYKSDARTPQDLAMFHAAKTLADHHVITFDSGDAEKIFQPFDALTIHKDELDWLEEQLARKFNGKTVVVTHHGPHQVCQHPRFPVNELTGAFHSDLSSLIDDNDIDIWIYGHTHANLDVVVSDTRIIANQAGYPGENVPSFNAGLVIEI